MSFLKNTLAVIGAVAVAGVAVRVLTSEKTENALKCALKKCNDYAKEDSDDCNPGCAGCCCGECECVDTTSSDEDCSVQEETTKNDNSEPAAEEPTEEENYLPPLNLKPNEAKQDGNQ